MNVTRTLTSAIAATAIVSAVGLAYAQTTGNDSGRAPAPTAGATTTATPSATTATDTTTTPSSLPARADRH